MAEIGRSGLLAFGAGSYNGSERVWILEDFLREWRLPQSVRNANEMRLNSPIVAALLAAIEQSIGAVEWVLTSADGEDDPRLEIWADSMRLVEGGFDDFIQESMTMLPFGFCLFEIVWGEYNGRTVVKKLAPRGQDTVFGWGMDDNGVLTGFTQAAAPTYRPVFIPAEKILHITGRREKGNPEGRSILRPAWTAYYYCKNIMQIEAIGIERDLAGLPMVKLPPSASTDENDSSSDAYKAAKLVRNIRNDEQAGAVLPDGWELSLLSTGGSRQFDTNTIITRYESRILMTALAQFLLLGQQGVGSLALSRDQSSLFIMAVNATADRISDAVNTQLLPRLMALNGYTAEGLGLTHTPAGDAETLPLVDAVLKLSQAGALTPMPADEVYYRKLLGLPEIDPEELEEERERKRAALEAAQQALTQGMQGGREGEKPEPERVEEADAEDLEPGGEEVDENAAVIEFFTSDRPDAVNRRRYEKKMQRGIAALFKNMKNKIAAKAKEARRG